MSDGLSRTADRPLSVNIHSLILPPEEVHRSVVVSAINGLLASRSHDDTLSIPLLVNSAMLIADEVQYQYKVRNDQRLELKSRKRIGKHEDVQSTEA